MASSSRTANSLLSNTYMNATPELTPPTTRLAEHSKLTDKPEIGLWAKATSLWTLAIGRPRGCG